MSSATPNSGSGGKITPTTPTNKTPVTRSPDLLQVSPTGKTGSASSEVESLPLPPYYSPEGSCVQSVQSGPYLDPPAEFSSQNVPPSANDQPTSSPTPVKPHPPINGGIRYQQVDFASPDQRHENGDSDSFHTDQATAAIANSNGNNSNPVRRRIVPVVMENGGPVLNHHPVSSPGSRGHPISSPDSRGHPVSSPGSRGLQRADKEFPSRSSILTHSDNAETRSSMESGFDADVELENATAWYLSSDSSPKPDSKVPKPRLGPKVAVGSPHSGGQSGQVSLPPPMSRRNGGNVASDHVAHYQQYSGTASDVQSPGGSQKSRESSISDYDRLHHEQRARQQQNAVVHEYENLGQSRRSSVPGEVGQLEDNEDPFYSEILPVHKASKSFDSAEILSGRLYSEEVPPNVARFTSPPPHPPPSAVPKTMRGHAVLFNGHSPTPGAPLSPVTITPAYHQHPSGRGAAGPSGTTAGYRDNVRVTDAARNHSRSRSQPEEFASADTPSPLVALHSNSQPHYSNNQHTSQQYYHHQYYHHQHHRKDRHSSRSGHRRYVNQPLFKSSYPGHHKSTSYHKSHRNDSKSRQGSGGAGGRGGRGQRSSQFPTVARVIENQPYVDEGSQESTSGRGTPETTPTLASRREWTNGNDSGFDKQRQAAAPYCGGKLPSLLPLRKLCKSY